MSHLNVNDVRSEACSHPHCNGPTTAPPARVRDAITAAVRQYGSRGCAALMAQEFGDHPTTAVARMRWARQVVEEVFRAESSRGVAPPTYLLRCAPDHARAA
jgi:hypothetical protein